MTPVRQNLTPGAVYGVIRRPSYLRLLVMPLKDLSRRLTYVQSFDDCTIIEVM